MIGILKKRNKQQYRPFADPRDILLGTSKKGKVVRHTDDDKAANAIFLGKGGEKWIEMQAQQYLKQIATYGSEINSQVKSMFIITDSQKSTNNLLKLAQKKLPTKKIHVVRPFDDSKNTEKLNIIAPSMSVNESVGLISCMIEALNQKFDPDFFIEYRKMILSSLLSILKLIDKNADYQYLIDNAELMDADFDVFEYKIHALMEKHPKQKPRIGHYLNRLVLYHQQQSWQQYQDNFSLGTAFRTHLSITKLFFASSGQKYLNIPEVLKTGGIVIFERDDSQLNPFTSSLLNCIYFNVLAYFLKNYENKAKSFMPIAIENFAVQSKLSSAFSNIDIKYQRLSILNDLLFFLDNNTRFRMPLLLSSDTVSAVKKFALDKFVDLMDACRIRYIGSDLSPESFASLRPYFGVIGRSTDSVVDKLDQANLALMLDSYLSVIPYGFALLYFLKREPEKIDMTDSLTLVKLDTEQKQHLIAKQ